MITLVLAGGCTTTQTLTQLESRQWDDTHFVDTLRIVTEPSGCKVYVDDNYVGISPTEAPIRCLKVGAIEVGTYPYTQTYDWFWGSVYGGSRSGDTTWDGKIRPKWKKKYAWTVKVFAEGYEPGTNVIEIDTQNDMRLQEAFANAHPDSEGRLQRDIKAAGYRSVLIALRPTARPFTPPAAQPQQQQQQQQQTVVVPGSSGAEQEKMGSVIVSANVEGAEVVVDGMFAGNAPANLKLPGGVHVIEVRKSGYQSYKRELRVFGNSELSLRAELEKQ
jgi:hypothetical protein